MAYMPNQGPSIDLYIMPNWNGAIDALELPKF